MQYCNNMQDEYVTQERFEKGIKLILDKPEMYFYECQDVRDVLKAINWPNIY